MTPQWRLILSLLALLAVLVVGTAGYMVIEEDPAPTFVDAAYMTVVTVSTVGLKEVWDLSPTGRMWTMGLIVVGGITVWSAVSSLVTLFVSGDLRQMRERRRMETMIGRMKDHVIFCGHGRMGGMAAKDLAIRDVPLVVIEEDPKRQKELRDYDIPCIIGDATDEDVLLSAGLLRAKAMVAVLASDADNVFVTLTAHTLQPDLLIIARAEQPSSEVKLKRAGAARVVCPHRIGAIQLVNVLTRPSVTDFVEVAQQGVDLELDEFGLGEHSPLVGAMLKDSRIREKCDATVVAIKRHGGHAIYNPEPTVKLEVRDTLILVGPAGVSDRLKSLGPRVDMSDL